MADQTPPELWWSPGEAFERGQPLEGLFEIDGAGTWRQRHGLWAPVEPSALPSDAVPLIPAEPVDDKGRTPTYLRGEADGRLARQAGAGAPPVSDDLAAYLYRYCASWELSHEDGVRVWNDPDGGELRIVQALRRVLQETDHTDVRAIVGEVFAAPGANDTERHPA